MIRALLAGWLVVAAVGCEKGLNRQEVSGTASYLGKPLKYGSIELSPAEGQPKQAGASFVDGKFTIAKEGGPVPGRYAVKINAPDRVSESSGPPGSDAGPQPKELIPEKYNAQTELTVEIKDGKGKNVLTFDLK